MSAVRATVIEIAIMIAIGLLLAALGPFGSFTESFAARLLYWVPTALIGYAVFRPITWIAGRLADWLNLPMIAATYVGGLVAAVPGTLAIAMFGGFRPSRGASFEALFDLYLNVSLVGLVIGTIFILVERRRGTGQAVPDHAPIHDVKDSNDAPAFHDRLSPGFPIPVIALEMEDHYVRAHGIGGRSELVLLRMRDAVAELGAVDGERVHRSWWVARAAVVGKRRAGRNWVLRLDGDLEAPVARDRVPELRKKGLL